MWRGRNLPVVKQAAAEIGVTTVTLWRWEREGRVATYRIGREVLIERRVVELLKQGRQ